MLRCLQSLKTYNSEIIKITELGDHSLLLLVKNNAINPDNEIVEKLKILKFEEQISQIRKIQPIPSGFTLLTFDPCYLPWCVKKYDESKTFLCKNYQSQKKKICNKHPVCDKCALTPTTPHLLSALFAVLIFQLELNRVQRSLKLRK